MPALVLLGAIVLVTAVAGCSSSKSSKSSPNKTSSTTVSSAVSQACNAWIEVEKVASSGPGGPDEQPDAAAVKAFATTLATPVDAFTGLAPAAVKADATTIQGIVHAATQGQNLDQLDPSSPALATPLTGVEKWVHTACPFTKLNVQAVDYGYKGLPATVRAGKVSLELTNTAMDEEHELSILRIKDGSDVTSDELVKALVSDPNGAEQKYGDKVDFVADVSAAHDKTNYTTTDLTPGDYVAVCFLPLHGQENGAPHVSKGMIQAFKVA
ncbi:MAG TPA: hypothetical protein VHA73_05730 [Acidimicrobiales bacterium]|jgi:hypothetical protein|nr:hypothetical protein [Acidimicrobiales bacterium]